MKWKNSTTRKPDEQQNVNHENYRGMFEKRLHESNGFLKRVNQLITNRATSSDLNFQEGSNFYKEYLS